MIFRELHVFQRIVCFPKLAAILKIFFWGNSDISLGIFTRSCDSYLILWCKLNLYIPISISALFLAALRACLRRSSSFLWDSDILAGSKMATAQGIARFTRMRGENRTGARHVGKLGTLYNRDVFCETITKGTNLFLKIILLFSCKSEQSDSQVEPDHVFQCLCRRSPSKRGAPELKIVQRTGERWGGGGGGDMVFPTFDADFKSAQIQNSLCREGGWGGTYGISNFLCRVQISMSSGGMGGLHGISNFWCRVQIY